MDNRGELRCLLYMNFVLDSPHKNKGNSIVHGSFTHTSFVSISIMIHYFTVILVELNLESSILCVAPHSTAQTVAP